MAFLMVGLGGAVGAMLRYGLSGWIHASGGFLFPLGTLVVNILGSYVIGVALQLGTGRFLLTPETRLFLTTGLCGGLTTFSTFSWETLRLLEGQQWAAAAANAVLNLSLCLAATFAGVMTARML